MPSNSTKYIILFANNLKKIMRMHDITTKKLSENSGVSSQAIYNYLHRKQGPSLEVAGDIAAAVGLSLSELIAEQIGVSDHPIEVCVQRVSERALGKTSKPRGEKVSLPPKGPPSIYDYLDGLRNYGLSEEEISILKGVMRIRDRGLAHSDLDPEPEDGR